MSEPPPPYFPPGPSGPSVPSFSSGPPSTFPGSLHQAFPQTFEGPYPYYQGPPGPPGPQRPTEPYLTQPTYQGSYYSGPSGTTVPWDGHKTYGDPPKQPVFMVEQNHDSGDGSRAGSLQSFLSACSATLCCCCLWNLLGQCF